MHWFAIKAVWWRQLQMMLVNPIAYIFLLVFALLAASVQYLPITFYTRNICDLQGLVDNMPLLMVVFIPAIAMNAWAGEREMHGDENLLTLPVSLLDLMLGKWLGLCSYWCIALLVSLSNVIILGMLGDPDSGLLIANYCAWLLSGLMLCAAALLASTLVAIPSVAFILGSLLCAACMYALNLMEWFDHFNRGRFHFSSLFSSLAIIGICLGLSVLVISSNRWQAQNRKRMFIHISLVSLVLFCIINISFIGQRHSAAIDITEEQLSTLSQESTELLHQLNKEIHLHAFIHKDLPDPYRTKGDELLDILDSIASQTAGHVHIHLYHPDNEFHPDALTARNHFGIKSKNVTVNNIVGGQSLNVYLGLAIQSGNNKQIIPFFDPGMSIEFHLMRALHTLNKDSLPQLGIVANDFPLLTRHDYQSDRMRAESPIVQEWRQRFNIIPLSLNAPIADNIDVLVCAMPSSLSDPELQHVQNYLAAGGKALLLDDPAPMWSHIELAPSFSRKLIYQKYGLPIPVNMATKGNIVKFYHDLGIYIDLKQIPWSEFNPSYRLSQMWPPSIIWASRSQQSITGHTACTGINSLLFPFPGHILSLSEPQTQVVPLVSTSPISRWGLHSLSDYITHNESQGFKHHQPKDFTASSQQYAVIAVHIEGLIPAALPTQTSTNKSAEIIMVADTDFIHDQFHALYTQSQPEFHEDDLAAIRRLQNIQFVNNCLDVLTHDTRLLPIRTRQLRYRSLNYIEDIQRQKEKFKRQVQDRARDETALEQARSTALHDKLIEDIQERSDLNELGKEQLLHAQMEAGKKALEAALINVKQHEAEEFKRAEVIYRQAIDSLLSQVKFYALIIPGLLLSLLAISVAIYRYLLERSLIPGQRLRSKS